MTPSRFDIYARADGRWRRLESIDGEERDQALAKGAALDGAGPYDGIRVMAVTEYDGGRPPLETLAWISPHLSRVASVSRQMRQAASAAEEAVSERAMDTDALSPKPTPALTSGPSTPAPEVSIPPPTKPRDIVKTSKAKRTKKGPLSVVGQLIWNAIVSVMIAAVTFVVASPIIRGVGAQSEMTASAQEQAAILLTLLVFFVSAFLLMGRVYRKHADVFASPDSKVEVASPRTRTNQSASVDRSRSVTGQGPVDQVPAPAPQKPVHETDTVPSKQPPPAGGGLDEGMRRDMLEFLEKALLAIKDEVPKMNRHVTFGLNLFISGAAERYGEHVNLSKMQSFVLIREMVEALGNSADRVDIYCRQYAEYAEQEAYRAMMDAGRDVMVRHIEKHAAPFEEFSDVMRAWTSDSAARARAQGIVCIMFTDLVGSTQMTHERGDYGAQEIVRIHNAIVRSSLAAHHGKEVKHTGDGIMASFSVAGNAVRAALEIQTELRRHNEDVANQPVNVRIGLNAGEAVEEEDDFFGTTVQIAARVCDKADTAEVFVTDTVQELSRGQGLVFEDAGKFEMKGVPEPMTLFRARINSPVTAHAGTSD